MSVSSTFDKARKTWYNTASIASPAYCGGTKKMPLPIVLHIIENYALAIYITCTAGILFYLRFFMKAQREERQSIFSLEKETASTEARRSMIVMFIFTAIMGATAFLDLGILPSQSRLPPTPTPTPVEIVPLTLTPSPTSTPTVTPTRRPTRRPRPTATPASPTQSPAPPPAACPNIGARITSPGMNAQVQGIVPIIGTASIGNFSFYKVEYGIGEHPSTWHSISPTQQHAVLNGTLDVWNTAGFPSGVYILRLTVVDQSGNYPPTCNVRTIIPLTPCHAL